MNAMICKQKKNKEKFGENGSSGTEMAKENFNMDYQ